MGTEPASWSGSALLPDPGGPEATSPAGDQIVVVHAASRWLPQTATWLYTQVRHLPASVESHVVCESTENLDQFALADIHSLGDVSRPRLVWDRALRRLRVRTHLGYLVSEAERVQARILHSHFGNVGWANLSAAAAAGIPHVVTFYGLDVNYLPHVDPRWRSRYWRLFDNVDRVLCEGPHMARCLMRMGCPPHRATVHHLGVSLEDIPFRPRAWAPGEPLRVLMAATFREKKGIPDGIRALAQVRREIPLEVTLMGDAPNDARSRAEKERILAVLGETGLASCTRLLGYRPHPVFLEEASRHHVFLAPSVTASDGDTEGGAPVSVIEAAAAGLAVVSTTHCDIPEVILPGRTGLLAPERNPEALASHILWLTRHPVRWRGMIEAGRLRMGSEFNAAIQGRRLARIYQNVLTGGVRRA